MSGKKNCILHFYANEMHPWLIGQCQSISGICMTYATWLAPHTRGTYAGNICRIFSCFTHFSGCPSKGKKVKWQWYIYRTSIKKIYRMKRSQITLCKSLHYFFIWGSIFEKFHRSNYFFKGIVKRKFAMLLLVPLAS
jgi:hypothetical protein